MRAYIHACIETDRQADRQTDNQTDRQTTRQTDRQTDRHTQADRQAQWSHSLLSQLWGRQLTVAQRCTRCRRSRDKLFLLQKPAAANTAENKRTQMEDHLGCTALIDDTTRNNSEAGRIFTIIKKCNSVRVKVEVISHVLVSPVTVCATHFMLGKPTHGRKLLPWLLQSYISLHMCILVHIQ